MLRILYPHSRITTIPCGIPLRILNLPLAHNHNPLRLVRKSDCRPLCNLLLIRELPRSFASGSLARYKPLKLYLRVFLASHTVA